tara:strand:+ start:377 stop:667 length:291 start_codon:yes stop_codon:yes gene_type:complete
MVYLFFHLKISSKNDLEIKELFQSLNVKKIIDFNLDNTKGKLVKFDSKLIDVINFINNNLSNFKIDGYTKYKINTFETKIVDNDIVVYKIDPINVA